MVWSAESSRSILEAFYYGRAFAETLNAKVGAVVEDVLSDIGKQSAESSQALRCCPTLMCGSVVTGLGAATGAKSQGSRVVCWRWKLVVHCAHYFLLL